MTVTNDFLVFAQSGGANVESQSDYLADPLLPIGNQPGIAISAFNNKAIRQANAVTSQLAQFVANTLQSSVLDNGVPTQLLAQLTSTFSYFSPVITTHLSGSGTHNVRYYFGCASANATSGATYTNNGNTYTVVNTISGGVLLQTTGPAAPTVSGTLTKASGTGDSSIIFYSFRAPLSIRVRAIGGGSGGQGAASSVDTTPTAGGDTTFGSLTAGGGQVAVGGQLPGTGGSASGGDINITGTPGGGGSQNVGAPGQLSGAMGGAGVFGGGGISGVIGLGAGGNAPANSGSGGGGGGTNNTIGYVSGAGGSAGGYVEKLFTTISSTYAWVVGSGGNGGTTGAGAVGGNGGSGIIIVEEIFQ